jgi:hypothetical protein
VIRARLRQLGWYLLGDERYEWIAIADERGTLRNVTAQLRRERDEARAERDELRRERGAG